MLETPLLTTFATKSIAGTFLKNVIQRYLQGISPPITCSTLVLAKEVLRSALNAGRGSNFELGEAPAGAGGLEAGQFFFQGEVCEAHVHRHLL